MKKVLLIGIGGLAGVIAVLLLLPPFIDLGAYKARYLPLLEETLHRKVDVGEVRLRIIPTPSIRISALNISDNPAFSKEPFFTAQQFKVKLKFWPLLKGQFQVAEFTLEKPSIRLLKRPDGKFNFSDMGKKKEGVKKKKVPSQGQKPVKKAVKFSELIPTKVRVKMGEVTFQTMGQKPLKIQGIDLSLDDFSSNRPFHYRVALNLPGLKPVVLVGLLQYDDSRATLNLRETHFKAQDVDLAVNGSITHLTGVPRVKLTLANDGFETKSIFKFLSAAGVTPKEMDVTGLLGLKVTLRGPSNALASQVNAEFKGLKVNDSRAFEGTLVGRTLLRYSLGGKAPLTRSLRGNGKIIVKDGRLTNVDLMSKIKLVTGLIGLLQDQNRGATTFEALEIDFTLGDGIVDVQRIYLRSPLMEALGSGRMTLTSPSVNFRIEAALASNFRPGQ